MTLPAELFAEAISLKQVVFACMTVGFLAVSIPLAIRFSWMDKVCVAGIMFMAINPVDVTFFSYTFYRGDIRGLDGAPQLRAVEHHLATHQAEPGSNEQR